MIWQKKDLRTLTKHTEYYRIVVVKENTIECGIIKWVKNKQNKHMKKAKEIKIPFLVIFLICFLENPWKQIKGENIETEINVGIEDAYFGTEKKISLRTVNRKNEKFFSKNSIGY